MYRARALEVALLKQLGSLLPRSRPPRLCMDFGLLTAAARELLPVILALGRFSGQSVSVPACPPCPLLNCGSLTCSGHAYSGVEGDSAGLDLRFLGWILLGGGLVIFYQFGRAHLRLHHLLNIPPEKHTRSTSSENELRARTPTSSGGPLALAATPSSTKK